MTALLFLPSKLAAPLVNEVSAASGKEVGPLVAMYRRLDEPFPFSNRDQVDFNKRYIDLRNAQNKIAYAGSKFPEYLEVMGEQRLKTAVLTGVDKAISGSMFTGWADYVLSTYPDEDWEEIDETAQSDVLERLYSYVGLLFSRSLESKA